MSVRRAAESPVFAANYGKGTLLPISLPSWVAEYMPHLCMRYTTTRVSVTAAEGSNRLG